MPRQQYKITNPDWFTVPSDDADFEEFHIEMKTEFFLQRLYEALPLYEKNSIYKAYVTEVVGQLLQSSNKYTVEQLYKATKQYLRIGSSSIPELNPVFTAYSEEKTMKLHTTLHLLHQ